MGVDGAGAEHQLVGNLLVSETACEEKPERALNGLIACVSPHIESSVCQ